MRGKFKLNLLFLRETVRKYFAVALLLIGCGFMLIIFDLNTPVYQDRVQGKVVRFSPIISRYRTGTNVHVQIEGDREITVDLPVGRLPPTLGDIVSIKRYQRRLFGDAFEM